MITAEEITDMFSAICRQTRNIPVDHFDEVYIEKIVVHTPLKNIVGYIVKGRCQSVIPEITKKISIATFNEEEKAYTTAGIISELLTGNKEVKMLCKTVM